MLSEHVEKIKSSVSMKLTEFAETEAVFKELEQVKYFQGIVHGLLGIRQAESAKGFTAFAAHHTSKVPLKEHLKLILSTLGILFVWHKHKKNSGTNVGSHGGE